LNEALTLLKNFTEVAPKKLKPVIVTFVLTFPNAGLKPIVDGFTVNIGVEDGSVAPPGVFTEIFPVIALVGTVAVIRVFELVTNGAPTLFGNFTNVAPLRFSPVMTRLDPTMPAFVEKLAMDGGRKKFEILV